MMRKFIFSFDLNTIAMSNDGVKAANIYNTEIRLALAAIGLFRIGGSVYSGECDLDKGEIWYHLVYNAPNLIKYGTKLYLEEIKTKAA